MEYRHSLDVFELSNDSLLQIGVSYMGLYSTYSSSLFVDVTIRPHNMLRCSLETLSTDILVSVLDFVPVQDPLFLKLVGNQYITETVGEYLSRMLR